MEINMVRLKLKKDKIINGLKEIKINAESSVINETNCRRFDVIQDEEDPSRIALCEIFNDLSSVDNHFSQEYFKKFTRNRKKNIKNLLMDQTFVSGLGNIYVNEALFMSRIKPLRLCNRLNINEIKSLIINVKKILRFSISKGGSSIRDFKNTLGKSGTFQQFFYVYGQENKNCSRISCKGKIKKIKISNRSSFYCNKCQN